MEHSRGLFVIDCAYRLVQCDISNRLPCFGCDTLLLIYGCLALHVLKAQLLCLVGFIALEFRHLDRFGRHVRHSLCLIHIYGVEGIYRWEFISLQASDIALTSDLFTWIVCISWLVLLCLCLLTSLTLQPDSLDFLALSWLPLLKIDFEMAAVLHAAHITGPRRCQSTFWWRSLDKLLWDKCSNVVDVNWWVHWLLKFTLIRRLPLI